jgi:agmatine deiminase
MAWENVMVVQPEGVRWPAEWEPHRATWLSWPHQKADWPGKFGPIPWVWAEIVRLVSRDESVELFVPEGAEKTIRGILDKAGADLKVVNLHPQPTNRVWMRDAGGIFVKDSKDRKTLLDWRFNAWAKYEDWQLDDALPQAMAKIRGLPKSRVIQPKRGKNRLVLEGGSIEGNGAGVMLTTRECLLSKIQERNPGLDQAAYEKVFQQYLGINKVLWLDRGIEGDDTHGHVDDLARFVGPERIVLVQEKDKSLPNYEPLRENAEILKGQKMPSGKRPEVIALPMPRPVVFRGQVLPASYANYILTNGSVLVPTFNDEADREALGILADCFPGRKAIGIHAVDLVWGLGTLHCLSQQEPA